MSSFSLMTSTAGRHEQGSPAHLMWAGLTPASHMRSAICPASEEKLLRRAEKCCCNVRRKACAAGGGGRLLQRGEECCGGGWNAVAAGARMLLRRGEECYCGERRNAVAKGGGSLWSQAGGSLWSQAGHAIAKSLLPIGSPFPQRPLFPRIFIFGDFSVLAHFSRHQPPRSAHHLDLALLVGATLWTQVASKSSWLRPLTCPPVPYFR